MIWTRHSMLVIATAFTLWFNLPTNEATREQCVSTDPPVKLRDLHTVRAWGMQRFTTTPVLLREKTVDGREGEADSLRIEVNDQPWVVWVNTTDSTGNVSCDSPQVGVNLTIDVPPDTISTEKWYDVAGRRVRPPLPPGVYIVRHGNHTRKVVKLP